MAINIKAVKTRIKSVSNTAKITKAMEMISAVKMRKAVDKATKTREYAKLATDLLGNLNTTDTEHALVKKRIVKNSLLIVITSNRGLCGSYNSKVLKEAYSVFSKNDEINYDVIAIGKKAGVFVKKHGLNLIGLYDTINENPRFEDILPISSFVIDKYKSEEYDQVVIVYTNYISGLIQKVEHRSILPFNKSNIDEMILEAGDDVKNKKSDDDSKKETNEYHMDYEYEPTKLTLLDYILPNLIEIQVYQALLESSASEHSSRMIAMKNASESADDMKAELILASNKGRQAAITQEVAEINAGADAVT